MTFGDFENNKNNNENQKEEVVVSFEDVLGKEKERFLEWNNKVIEVIEKGARVKIEPEGFDFDKKYGIKKERYRYLKKVEGGLGRPDAFINKIDREFSLSLTLPHIAETIDIAPEKTWPLWSNYKYYKERTLRDFEEIVDRLREYGIIVEISEELRERLRPKGWTIESGGSHGYYSFTYPSPVSDESKALRGVHVFSENSGIGYKESVFYFPDTNEPPILVAEYHHYYEDDADGEEEDLVEEKGEGVLNHEEDEDSTEEERGEGLSGPPLFPAERFIFQDSDTDLTEEEIAKIFENEPTFRKFERLVMGIREKCYTPNKDEILGLCENIRQPWDRLKAFLVCMNLGIDATNEFEKTFSEVKDKSTDLYSNNPYGNWNVIDGSKFIDKIVQDFYNLPLRTIFDAFSRFGKKVSKEFLSVIAVSPIGKRSEIEAEEDIIFYGFRNGADVSGEDLISYVKEYNDSIKIKKGIDPVYEKIGPHWFSLLEGPQKHIKNLLNLKDLHVLNLKTLDFKTFSQAVIDFKESFFEMIDTLKNDNRIVYEDEKKEFVFPNGVRQSIDEYWQILSPVRVVEEISTTVGFSEQEKEELMQIVSY